MCIEYQDQKKYLECVYTAPMIRKLALWCFLISKHIYLKTTAGTFQKFNAQSSALLLLCPIPSAPRHVCSSQSCNVLWSRVYTLNSWIKLDPMQSKFRLSFRTEISLVPLGNRLHCEMDRKNRRLLVILYQAPQSLPANSGWHETWRYCFTEVPALIISLSSSYFSGSHLYFVFSGIFFSNIGWHHSDFGARISSICW